MKKLLLTCVLYLAARYVSAQNNTLLPAYNNSFYPSVLQAAQGVAQPFLLQERYVALPGVTVKQDSMLVYDNVTYHIHNHYLNPTPTFNNGYYISSALYSTYNLPAAETNIWPSHIPYALYNSATNTFNSTVDCVGYGTRLLSATGSTNPGGNAYIQLMNYAHSNNQSPFAYRGFVATAYQIAVAFPTLPSNANKGWQYVAGNVMTHLVDSINHTQTNHKGLDKYQGTNKGGFAKALPGDILSFGYAPGASSNGHFMVIEKSPILLNQASLIAYFASYQQQLSEPIIALLQKYNVYAVPLFDCSGQNVHFNDSRKFMSGIGHGTLLVLTDKANDIPQGFIFSPPHSKPVLGIEYMGAHVVAITVGRYTL